MKIVQTKYLLILYILSFSGFLFCQNNATITNPGLRLLNHKLIIEYDILNSSTHDLFKIWFTATDSAGQNLNAVSLTGDIGNNITGGTGKTITWDIEKDGYYKNSDVFVEIKGEKIKPPEEVVPEKKDASPEKTERIKPAKEYKTIGLLSRSVLMPGMGQSLMANRKPYYLIGIIGYGCIGTSIYLNYKANDNYAQYSEIYTTDLDRALDLYDKADIQYKTSNILGYSAVAIWIADLVWTAIAVHNYQSQKKYSLLDNIKLDLVYDDLFLLPGVALNLKF
jgi:hypothetical protein